MARLNQGIYNAIISMGGSQASAMNAARAKKPGRAFRRFQAAFVPPAPAAPTPPQQPQAQQYQAPVTRQPSSSLQQTQEGVRTPRRSRRKDRLSQFLISLSQGSQVGAGGGGSLNIG